MPARVSRSLSCASGSFVGSMDLILFLPHYVIFSPFVFRKAAPSAYFVSLTRRCRTGELYFVICLACTNEISEVLQGVDIFERLGGILKISWQSVTYASVTIYLYTLQGL